MIRTVGEDKPRAEKWAMANGLEILACEGKGYHRVVDGPKWTSVFCMFGAALAITAFWAVPVSAPLAVKLLPFLAIGFFIYGPQALLGVATTQQATPRAAGVAGGFVGIFSYASTVLSGLGFGAVAQRWGWSAAYATILLSALIGGLVLLLIWRDPTTKQSRFLLTSKQIKGSAKGGQ